MPKKSAAARGGAQRNRPKLQKNIELVRPTTTSDEQALEADQADETEDEQALETDQVDQADETEDETNKTDKNAEPTAVASKAKSVNTAVAPKAKSVTTSTTRARSTTAPKVRETSARLATSTVKKEVKEVKEVEEEEEVSEETPVTSTATAAPATAPKSAAARLAARRQSGQKNQQRSAPTLITAEHYSYVRKDLVFIAVLAAIMFASIIILHFVPGIGS